MFWCQFQEDLSNGKDVDDSNTLYSRLDDPNVSDDDIEEVIEHLVFSLYEL